MQNSVSHPKVCAGTWPDAPAESWDVQICVGAGGKAIVAVARGNNGTWTSNYFGSGPFTLCMPKECPVSFMQAYMFPHLIFMEMFNMAPNASALPQDDGDEAAVIRMVRAVQRDLRIQVRPLAPAPFEPLPGGGLDFVIAGFPNSGTTSLVQELRRHPRVVISETGDRTHTHTEDQIFWTSVLTRSSIRSWAKPYLREAERKRRLLQDAGGRMLFGLKEPMMVLNPVVMQRVAKVPGLKVIVLVRDPIALLHSWVNHGLQWYDYSGQKLGLGIALLKDVLDKSTLSAIEPERLLLVPTSALSKDPAATYDRILGFLGLPRSDAKDVLQKRSNSLRSAPCAWQRRCVDFCDLPLDFYGRLQSALRPNLEVMDGLLARHSWPEAVRGLLPMRACRRSSPQARRTEDSLFCSPGFGWNIAAASPCFSSAASCARCCERFEDGCALGGQEWQRCCKPIVKSHFMQLQADLRQWVCGRTNMPCLVGRGRTGWNLFASVP